MWFSFGSPERNKRETKWRECSPHTHTAGNAGRNTRALAPVPLRPGPPPRGGPRAGAGGALSFVNQPIQKRTPNMADPAPAAPAAGPTDSLLRFFDSEWFDAWMAMM